MAVTGTIAPTRPASGLSEAEHRGQLRRAILAGTIGTTIEWYDFFLYSTVTGLVFAKLFFPESDRLVGTLEAFSVYALGFVARTVGAAIFGHYGDRIGRKSALIATLLLMGLATCLGSLQLLYCCSITQTTSKYRPKRAGKAASISWTWGIRWNTMSTRMGGTGLTSRVVWTIWSCS